MRTVSPSSLLLILFSFLAYCDDHRVDAFYFCWKGGKLAPFPSLSLYLPKAASRSNTFSTFSSWSTKYQKKRNPADVLLRTAWIKISQQDQSNFSERGTQNILLLERRYAFKLIVAQTITLVTSMGLTTAGTADDTENSSEIPRVLLSVPKEIKQLYNDGLAKQIQGNILAANRIFAQVTKLVPEVTSIGHVTKKSL